MRPPSNSSQVFARFCRAFIWVTYQRKKRSIICKCLHVTLKVSRNFVNICFDIVERDIAIYASDNTRDNFGFNLSNVISNLENSTNSLLNWLTENHMKANADKCHLLVSSDESCKAKIEDFSIKNSIEEKLVGVKFDSNLSFENHVTSLSNKASQKLYVLARISHYMNLDKHKNLMKALNTSQFSYCPLIWMFDSRNLNNKINRIHERALRLVYHNNLHFSELLNLDNSVTVHQKHLQVLDGNL